MAGTFKPKCLSEARHHHIGASCTLPTEQPPGFRASTPGRNSGRAALKCWQRVGEWSAAVATKAYPEPGFRGGSGYDLRGIKGMILGINLYLSSTASCLSAKLLSCDHWMGQYHVPNPCGLYKNMNEVL